MEALKQTHQSFPSLSSNSLASFPLLHPLHPLHRPLFSSCPGTSLLLQTLVPYCCYWRCSLPHPAAWLSAPLRCSSARSPLIVSTLLSSATRRSRITFQQLSAPFPFPLQLPFLLLPS